METDKTFIYRNPIYLIETRFLRLYVIVGLLLRVVLMLTAPQDAGFTPGEIIRLLGVGLLADIGMGILLALPLQILYVGLNEWKYNKVAGWALELLLAAALVYVCCFHTVFDEYGGGAPKIARILLTWKFLSFSFRFFVPKVRGAWRCCSLYFAWATYVLLFLTVTAGEYFFWLEFGVRYNFIAVDYLVYTHEVIGNIMESYSIVPLTIVLLCLTAAIVWRDSRRYRFKLTQLYTPRLFTLHIGIYCAFAVCAYLLLWGTHAMQSDNQYVTQLEQNGACDFIIAFRSNKLEYDKFYPMLPKRQCEEVYQKETGLDGNDYKMVGDTLGSNRPNIVLITVESLSADFLTRYGNSQHLTPQLDRLMPQSLVFDSLYAVGNRTVRGLEALSICIPPSAGESIIKRKDNRMGRLSVAAVLGRLGYRSQFLYGGDSYFDNMGDFFSHNGYEVIDRAAIPSGDITFANIWGVCDEDIFSKALKVFDADARSRRPFFAQIMTTSNHRPYTYPDGRIRREGDPHTREAAVRYTDYAIGHFISEARREPWFANTVFVVIADHCASSAGRTSLPIERYHIPCLVYAPGLIRPQYVKRVCSQIDVMPTLISLLRLKSRVGFAGRDIFADDYRPRAFMATYQDLGYYEPGRLTVLSPVRRVRQYSVRPAGDGTFEEQPISQPDTQLTLKAQAFYQHVNLYLK
jgi:phosphoglycerol transferase MdoB-like AlkP superfamily enzyme